MMSRVLIGVLNNGEGGTEQCLRMIARHYSKKDIQVDVLILNNNLPNKAWDDLIKNEFNVSIFKANKPSELLGFFYLLKFLMKRKKYDYIYSSHLKVSLIIGALIRFNVIPNTKFVARESYSSFLSIKGWKKRLFQKLYVFGYKKVNLIVCQTNDMKLQFDLNLKQYSTKSVVIKNPIDLELIKKSEEVTDEKDLQWLENNEFIVAAGRLIYLKGYDLLIEAFRSISIKNPQLTLVILGEGEKRQELEELILRLDLQNKVILQGFVDNVYPFFKYAKLCVISSRSEGFPNVLLQMMSQNDKIVSTKCAGGIDEIDGVYSCDISTESLIKNMEECLTGSQKPGQFKEALKKLSVENFIAQVDKDINGAIK